MTADKSQIETTVPVLMLMGKTGAGKTSLIQALTGEGEPGQGFEPSAKTSTLYDFPAAAPALRFLDTRGLGEAGYDPTEALKTDAARSHAVLAVVRLDDPVQTPLITALKPLRMPVLVVFTGADLMPDPAQQAEARAAFLDQLRTRAPDVALALPADGLVVGIENLIDALDSFMPHAAAILRRAAEARDFAKARSQVLRYAAMAGAVDVVPVAGLATVPVTQTAMLQALAKRHGVALTPARLGVLASALGTGTLARLAASHLLRQGAKMIPVAGQTIGAAAAAGTSFATTYALGRAGSAWLYNLAHGTETDPTALRKLYEQALKGAPNASG